MKAATKMVFSGPVSPVHEDNRRAIKEFNSPEGGFSVQIFAVKEAIPLGNHSHAKKEEVFVITKGGGNLVTVPVDENGLPIGGALNERIDAPYVVKIPAWVAHTFVLDPGSEMVCVSSAPFDPANQDMHPCKLV